MSIFFITIELFRQRVTCRTDRTIHEAYISFQISRKVFLCLSVLTIHAQKKSSFPLNSSKERWLPIVANEAAKRRRGADEAAALLCRSSRRI